MTVEEIANKTIDDFYQIAEKITKDIVESGLMEAFENLKKAIGNGASI